MKIEYGKLWRADGRFEEVLPNDGKKFSLSELQGFVGGNIELVPRSEPHAYCNEEGTLDGLPINLEASKVFNSQNICGVLLCGDVIQVCKRAPTAKS